MTKATEKERVDNVVGSVMEKMGVPLSDASGVAPDWTKLQDIARELQTVTVHLIRFERSSFFTKSTTPIDAGTYYNVPVERLQVGTAEWIYEQAGGGEYRVEVIHPTSPRMGLLTTFKVNVPGEPRKPAPLAAKEALRMSTSQDQVQGLARQFASMNPGLSEMQALEMAQKTAAENPALASMMVGQEDEMAFGQQGGFNVNGMIQMMMAERMMERQAAREQQYKPPAAPQEDPTVRLLTEQMREMKAQLERERDENRRREEQREAQAKFDRLESKFELLLQRLDKPQEPKTDPTALVLSTVLPALTGSQERTAAEHARGAAQQLEFMKAMAESSNRRDPALESLLAHMLDTTRLSMEAQQLRLQEPVKNAEAMNSMIGMMAGVMQTTHSIVMAQMQAQQGNPFWDKLAGITDALPGIIMALASPEVEHGTIEASGPAAPDVSEQAAAARVQQMRAADAAAQAAAQVPAGAPPPAQVAPAPVEPPLPATAGPEQAEDEDEDEGDDELPEDPIERAKIVLDIFGLEGAADVLLKFEDAVTTLNLFFFEGAAPSVLGEKFAALLIGAPDITFDVSGDQLVRTVREQFGWNPQRSGKFVKAFEEALAKAAAPAA
ncbi:MAG: hypothetical protein M0R22_00170 [Dehalococcoidia bacterium]|jgi:hypothetical protein|nr:hypothetical protein [Dehalococcoidia bacterium]